MHKLTLRFRLITIVLLAIAVVLVRPFSAFAGPCDSGCNLNDPSCTVKVCDPGRGNSGAPVGGGSDGGQGSASGSIGSSNAACVPPPGVPLDAWQQVVGACAAPGQRAPVAGGPPPPSPAVLAQEALASIHFPRPSGHRTPSESLLYQGYAFTYLRLWTFFWTDPGTWRTLSATASAGGVSATVTAAPVSLSYDPGDGGSPVTCNGPGRPWTTADGNDAPSAGACGYQYRRVSDAPITATETLTWRVTWVGTGNSAGELPAMSTSTAGQLRVLQVQVVNR
jgi:hypothetical protein